MVNGEILNKYDTNENWCILPKSNEIISLLVFKVSTNQYYPLSIDDQIIKYKKAYKNLFDMLSNTAVIFIPVENGNTCLEIIFLSNKDEKCNLIKNFIDVKDVDLGV